MGKAGCRRADIVKADHVGHICTLGQVHHFACTVECVGNGFFAQYRFAQCDRLTRDGFMRILGRCDDNGLDLGIVYQITPIPRSAFVSITGAIAFCAFGRGGCDRLQNRAQFCVKHGANRGHGNAVRLAHIATANNANSDFCHIHPQGDLCFRTE